MPLSTEKFYFEMLFLILSQALKHKDLAVNITAAIHTV